MIDIVHHPKKIGPFDPDELSVDINIGVKKGLFVSYSTSVISKRQITGGWIKWIPI